LLTSNNQCFIVVTAAYILAHATSTGLQLLCTTQRTIESVAWP